MSQPHRTVATRPGRRRGGAPGVLRWSLRTAGPRLAVAWLCGVGYQGGLLLLPWCLGRALDSGISSGDRAVLLGWAGAVLAVSVLLTAGEMGMRWFAVLAANRTANRLVARLDDQVLRLDADGVGRFPHGDLVTRGTRDVEAVGTWLASTPSLLSGLLGCAAVIAVIAALDPALAVIGLATIPLLVLVNLFYPARFERANQRVSAAHADRADAVEDLLTASTAVRGLGGEQVLVRRHHGRSTEVTTRTLDVARVAASWSAYAPFIPALATGVGLLTGGLAVLDGRLTVGSLVTFITWMTLLSLQVTTLTQRFNLVSLAWTAAGRIGAVLAVEPALTEPADPAPLPASGELVATCLRVELPGRPTLTLPELRVAPGQVVAVTGLVGTGKSTLLRLLARLKDPAAGEVSYGGVRLDAARLAEVRQRITLVGQRPTLLSGTVAENLRLGRPELTDDELRAACRVAAIDDHLGALPDGYDTDVGERGGTLSGGQVQRLALARALLRRAPVLLLDDVTSAVDAGTERALLDRLRDWSPGTAIVVATSRPTVAEWADRVIDLLPTPTDADSGVAPTDAVPAVDSALTGGSRA